MTVKRGLPRRSSKSEGGPGFIHTDMHASGGEPNRIERVKAFVPLRRGGTPEEVAHAILLAAFRRSVVYNGWLHRRRRRQVAMTKGVSISGYHFRIELDARQAWQAWQDGGTHG